MKSSVKSFKKHVEHVDPSYFVLDNGVGSLEFVYVNLPLTPHHIGIG
jgi:hypothetical protein